MVLGFGLAGRDTAILSASTEIRFLVKCDSWLGALMVATALSSLTDLANHLERQLNNPASYRAIVTRVLLRTGVNMREPKPTQNQDSAMVSKVAGTLAEMGYRFQS